MRCKRIILSSQTLVILSGVLNSSHSKAQLKSYRVQGRSFKVERPTRAKLGRCVMHICLCDLLSRDTKDIKTLYREQRGRSETEDSLGIRAYR